MKTKADVAKYLSRCIHLSGKSNKDIAREAGFDQANIVSMMKSGETKVPLARIPAIAEAVGTDPKVLLDICLEAYHPELHGVLASLAPSMLISRGELAIIRALRRAVRIGAIT